tara:strand:- start:181 stop:399 length:219 start_codon:yes stop_codon:yes gene_type:complete
MYKIFCETKINENVTSKLIKTFENQNLEFETFDQAFSYYSELFDKKGLNVWWPTYDNNNSKYRIVIKEVDNK